MAKNELTTVEKFNLVTGMEEMDEELKAELEDELGDLDEENGILQTDQDPKWWRKSIRGGI